MATEEERAQLWAIYFGLRSLKNPPLFLAGTQAALWGHLRALPPEEPEPTQPPCKPKRRRASHLSVIGGGV